MKSIAYTFACVPSCSGCRADANEAAVVLLPSNITLFTLDFSGSGLSGGNYVSLGCHEVYFSSLSSIICYLQYFIHGHDSFLLIER